MPVVELTLIEGYDAETRTRLGERLTDAVRTVIAAPLDGVTVAIHEVKAESYMRGRQQRQPGKPLADPVDLVRAFLAAMEARDLDGARGFLADDFRMSFPGGAEFGRLEQLVEWARERYRFVRKTYDRFDVTADADGPVVYCFGTLSGEWLDGAAFSGIRFIDRFAIRDGLLADQKVWNDLAESGRRE
ncbi:tautomerase family protein [Microbaculum marinisediminis]|uniref:Tautomerase family protein n=1 Tax=Microbaculum marinisediminis TaxID=2931392 RepID=A0AAW5R2Q8_9HYPH|nr:tautomerase family protein [Microbaculum sp. A6E488]MCT8973672.1 tautomerase family protein [Microbaculum sp. A6E488]